MSKSNFCIAHTPRYTGPFANLQNQSEVGKVTVIALRAQLPSPGLSRSRAHRTKARKYPALEGPRMVLPRDVTPAIEGYPLRLITTDEREYVQRNGIRYRLDRLVAAGRVRLPEAARP